MFVHFVFTRYHFGDCGLLVNTMNYVFVSVSDHLSRLNTGHNVFNVNEELPDQYVIRLCTISKPWKALKPTRLLGLTIH